jgi:hypothetical protein
MEENAIDKIVGGGIFKEKISKCVLSIGRV